MGDVNEYIADAKYRATHHFSAVETIRADAALIEQQYQIIESRRLLAEKLAERAKALLDGEAFKSSPVSAMPLLIEQYNNLMAELPRVDSLRRQLADAASDLGYKLFLEKTKVTYIADDGSPTEIDLDAGLLFRTSERTVVWVTYQTVTRTSRSWFRKRTTTYRVPVEHKKTYTYYEEVRPDHDPWVEVADAYRKNSMNVFLFRETAAGLVAPDGSTVAGVLERCRWDEAFRTTCAIGVPSYEYTIIGERLLVGYIVLIRPTPELWPADFPAICVDEKLIYKFAWEGTALGELAATVPLAPGEERTVSLTVSQKLETSRTFATTSLSEVTRVDKADFESVFEKEVRKEKETTETSGGSVGGSYGPVSGSANFSRTTTTRDMSRQLNRAVQKTSQELTRRAKEEVSVSFSEKSETSQVSTTTYKVRNINEGRTLNVNLFRLFNQYRSVLVLDDFDFYVESGRELISGTGMREGRSFSRTGLEYLFDHLLQDGVLPIHLLDKKTEFKIALCTAMAAQMKKEYEGHSASISGDTESLLAKLRESEGMSVEQVPSLARAVAIEASGSGEIDAQITQLLTRTFSTENCDFEGFLKKHFNETRFSYDSGGLYADAQVGVRPATEDYSERMREVEIKSREGQNALVAAKAGYLNARSAKIAFGIGDIIDESKVYATDRDGIYLDSGHVRLRLRLSHALLPSIGWTIEIAGGGRFVCEGTPPAGAVDFILPRRFSDPSWDIANKPHQWFEKNVKLENTGLGISLRYRPPGSPT